MTVRVERTFDVAASPADVWEFISDPERRAAAISVVDSYDRDGETTTWHVRLPIPMVRSTIAVETRDVEVRPPEYVKFVGKSRVFSVTGEHEVEAIEDGSRVTNRFVVEGKLPGVEQFFKRNLDDELDALQDEMEAEV